MLLGMLGQIRQVALGDQVIPIGSAQFKILTETDESPLRQGLTEPAKGATTKVDGGGFGIDRVLRAGIGALPAEGWCTAGVDLGSTSEARIQGDGLFGIGGGPASLLNAVGNDFQHGLGLCTGIFGNLPGPGG